MFKKWRRRLKSYNAKLLKFRNKGRLVIGFTLVELIVVSVILSIFLLLAVLMFQGLIKDTRDSSRVTDIRQISTSIEGFQVVKGHFPEPDNSVDILFSGSLIWKQGSFGDSTLRLVDLLSRKPVDSLTKTDYAYSISNNNYEYQLGVVIEGNAKISSILFPQTYAGDRLGRTYTIGNYNGYLSSICTGDMIYVLSLPSILTNDTIENDVSLIVSNKALAFKGFNNLPETYKDTVFDEQGGFDFNPSNFVVYAGNKDSLFLSGGLKIQFLKNLQEAYRGTILENKSPFKEILKMDTSIVNHSLISYINKTFSDNLCGGFVDDGNTNGGELETNVTPTCGLENGTSYNYGDLVWASSDFCGVGIANPVTPAFPTEGANTSWLCENEGNSVTCSADRDNMFVAALFGGDSRGLAEDPSGKIWIASKNGVGVLSGGAIDNIYDESDGLADNQTRSIIVDSSGNYWIATLKGISYFDGTNWITYDVSDGVASNDTVYLYEDSSGNIWTATNKGVSVFDGTNWTTYDQGDGLINKEVNCITQTLDGNMWFGTQHGVSKYDGTSWTDYTTSNGLPNNEVLSCYADDLGNIWLGTKDGVGMFDDSSWLIYNVAQGLANKFVQAILKDSTGVMWFGTHEGLSRLDSGVWTTFTVADGLTDNDIQYLFQDSTGAIWIATKNGVSIY